MSIQAVQPSDCHDNDGSEKDTWTIRLFAIKLWTMGIISEVPNGKRLIWVTACGNTKWKSISVLVLSLKLWPSCCFVPDELYSYVHNHLLQNTLFLSPLTKKPHVLFMWITCEHMWQHVLTCVSMLSHGTNICSYVIERCYTEIRCYHAGVFAYSCNPATWRRRSAVLSRFTNVRTIYRTVSSSWWAYV